MRVIQFHESGTAGPDCKVPLIVKCMLLSKQNNQEKVGFIMRSLSVFEKTKEMLIWTR